LYSEGVTLIVQQASVWALPDELTHFIITALFKQVRADTSALVRGKITAGQTQAWLYTADRYYPISLADHAKFLEAAKSRGSEYSIEICEFEIEERARNGDIVLNFWRHFGDDSGEGGRVLVSQQNSNTWAIAKRLKGWWKKPIS
jgi:hypothetical protein